MIVFCFVLGPDKNNFTRDNTPAINYQADRILLVKCAVCEGTPSQPMLPTWYTIALAPAPTLLTS